MMKPKAAILYTDGASRGNPGDGGAGAVLYDIHGEVLVSAKKYLGHCTNNVAEYKALILGLNLALENECRSISVFLDSELLVKQIKGLYRVKNAALQTLMQEVTKLLARMDHYTVEHVARSHNTYADRLANEAIDEA